MHESNSFNRQQTSLLDFRFRQGPDPEATLADWAQGNTEVAGFVEEGAKAGFAMIPILYASATPSGPVAPEAFEELCARLTRGLAQQKPLDGILLALHGAMYTEQYPHADEEIIRRVRGVVGPEIPLVVTH